MLQWQQQQKQKQQASLAGRLGPFCLLLLHAFVYVLLLSHLIYSPSSRFLLSWYYYGIGFCFVHARPAVGLLSCCRASATHLTRVRIDRLIQDSAWRKSLPVTEEEENGFWVIILFWCLCHYAPYFFWLNWPILYEFAREVYARNAILTFNSQLKY